MLRILAADVQVDFTCPGLLGTYAKFVKHYEKPIMKSRTPGCKGQALQDGRDRADEVRTWNKAETYDSAWQAVQRVCSSAYSSSLGELPTAEA